jgi:dipeptidyl aminopeptidase/acylaminoacyl peptidase
MTDRSTGADGGGSARWRLLAALVLMVVAGSVQAMVHVVDPGEIPQLKPNEGLLLVEVDSNCGLESIRVKKDGTIFNAGVLTGIKQGQTAQLYVVPAGRYAWAEINAYWMARYELKDKPEYGFDVVPGKITYAGDLIIRLTGFYSADLQLSNRGLQAMDWLEAQHPALASRYEFTYTGHYPDPFPAFYKQARTASTASVADLGAVQPPPKPGPLPLAIRDLWRHDRIDWVSLNPAGDLLVEALHEKDDLWALELIDLKSNTAVRLAESPLRFAALDWSGDRVLIAGVGESEGRQLVTVFRIGEGADGKRTFTTLRIRQTGHVLATSYGAPDRILFESYGDEGRVLVHELDISSKASLDQFQAMLRNRLNVGVEKDTGWYADGHGRLRAATAKRGDDRYVLMYGQGSAFQEVMAFDGVGGFQPQALSFDGDLIYGVSDDGRAQRDLVEFDPAQRRVTRTLFSKPGVDVLAPVLDDHRRPIGALYFEGGRLVNEYFDAAQQQLAGVVQRTFPGKTLAVADRSRDGQHLMLWVQGSDQPPLLYHLDLAHSRAALLDPAAPWLEGKTFAASQLVRVKSADGLPIEAYLTLPPAAGKRPLVVLPHGGPVGVADEMLFNPEVQLLASLGYAVLQVNFRGSDGYGKAFREAGYHTHGTLIEDDIDTALTEVLAHYPLDPQRMCVMGSSYGGYSALVSTVRWPQRFRCAVSISGVSDRVLFFTASDGGNSAKGRQDLERVIGNPNTELDRMLATSPLYRYREMQVPVMLVHGGEDMRVDYEHSRRLVRMLNMAGHKPVMLSFDKEGHGLTDIDDIDKAYSGIAGFLQQYLGTSATATTTSSSAGALPTTAATH